jgi:hypothetical protein
MPPKNGAPSAGALVLEAKSPALRRIHEKPEPDIGVSAEITGSPSRQQRAAATAGMIDTHSWGIEPGKPELGSRETVKKSLVLPPTAKAGTTTVRTHNLSAIREKISTYTNGVDLPTWIL